MDQRDGWEQALFMGRFFPAQTHSECIVSCSGAYSLLSNQVALSNQVSIGITGKPPAKPPAKVPAKAPGKDMGKFRKGSGERPKNYPGKRAKRDYLSM